jgi:signal transduction histidine kinase
MQMVVSHPKNFWRNALLWACAVILALGGLAFFERQNLVREMRVKSETLHRLASQRADQHDAHLTSLSAIFLAGGVVRQEVLLDVAATIRRFYPRITSVNIVPYDSSQPVIETQPGLSAQARERVVELARRSTGALQIGQMPDLPDHYLLVKRTPNSDSAQHGLALVIDARAMIATDDPFWNAPSASLRLSTPNGQTALVGHFPSGETGFSKPLGSVSQPLVFETSLAIGLSDLLPLGKVLSVVVLVTAVFLLSAFGFKQRVRTKDAENRAKLSAQETRLAHASRVNAMGEMASGMAHELAQPLTAILSQAQAGLHLARRGDVERLGTVLEDTVSQAQRAANILDRLRRWSKPNRAPSEACSVHEAAQNVQNLVALEAKNKGAAITLSLHGDPLFIDADPVELEQVVFNLVRNALDASDAAQVTIRTHVDGRLVILDVSDTGPGVPDHLKPRIFEPFVTGKPDGTGLGLALCQRLVEEMGGEIMLLGDTDQTTFRMSLPISNKAGAQ